MKDNPSDHHKYFSYFCELFPLIGTTVDHQRIRGKKRRKRKKEKTNLLVS